MARYITPSKLPALSIRRFPSPWRVSTHHRTMATRQDGELYLLKRDEVEKQRLTDQHRFLTALLRNNIVHPSIPNHNSITAVADVGTGTGIWLQDLTSNLPSPSESLDLHGFDISPAQFPPGHELRGPLKDLRIPLSVHDAVESFPPEHKGRYDLVHIRLLTAALKIEDYKTVLANVRELLKPKGYIQWEEVDDSVFCTDKFPELPAVLSMQNSTRAAFHKLGMSSHAHQRVCEEAYAMGFQKICRQTYTTSGMEYLHDEATKWVAGVIRGIITPSLIVTGEAKDEAESKNKVDELVSEFEKHCENALPRVNFTIVVIQV